MALEGNYVIDASMNDLGSPDREVFLRDLAFAMDQLAEKVPHGSSLRVSVENIGGLYQVTVQLASSGLTMSEFGKGESPFFALENALNKIHSRLKIWSAHRRF